MADSARANDSPGAQPTELGLRVEQDIEQIGDLSSQTVNSQGSSRLPSEPVQSTLRFDDVETVVKSIEHHAQHPEELILDNVVNETQEEQRDSANDLFDEPQNAQRVLSPEGGSHEEMQSHDEVMADAQEGMQEEAMEDVQTEPGIQGNVPDVVQPVHSKALDGGLDEHQGAAVNTALKVQEEPEPQQDLGHDETSLFVPEERVSATRTVRPPPSGPTRSTPSAANPHAASTFTKIRQLQKKLQMKKAAVNKPTNQYRVDPDSETYLNAILPSAATLRNADEFITGHPHEKTDALAAAQYHAQKNRYDDIKKQNRGVLPFRQAVEWTRIESAERMRKEKIKWDLQRAQEDRESEDELFPSVLGPMQRHTRQDEDSDNDMLDPNSRDSRKRRRGSETLLKEHKRVSMREAELNSMRVALDADRDMPKKKRKDQEDSPGRSSSRCRAKPNSRAKPKPRTSASSAKKPRQTAKQKKDAANALRQTASLFSTNVFQQQAPEGAPDEPTFRSKNKQIALRELLASVPIEDKKTVQGDMGALVAATKAFRGHGSAKSDGNGMWLIKGMKTSLKGYQLLGSAFMRRREEADEEPRGGLSADQMGLGKTLMMLANIVNGRPGKNEECKTTLLVASPALLTQWAREISLHTNAGLAVMRYGPGTRIDSNQCYKILQHHDIILTTYTEIMRSYPKNEPPIEMQSAEQKMEWWKQTYEKNRGVLHRMLFYRVVLDEAQAIKNHTGRTSIACRALMAQHKWALSGTPILNSLTELYPYFKFLNVPFTGNFKIFKNNYCDDGNPENVERLLVRLAQFMIRRTHADKMFNAPILKLPKADQLTHWCDFNPVERSIYDIVRCRFAQMINSMQKAGDLEKSYSNALVMILRLRQLCSHVLMLQFVMRDLLLREDIERIREVVKDAAADGSSRRGRYITAIRKQLDDLATKEKNRTAEIAAENGVADDDDADAGHAADEEDEESGDEGRGYPGGGNKSGEAFGKDYNFKPFLKSLSTGNHWKKAKAKARCAFGNHRPKCALITSCGHLTCQDCYLLEMTKAAEENRLKAACGACGASFDHAQPVDPDGDEEDEYSGPETRSKKKPTRIEREDLAEDWLSFGGESVLPSAKTIAVKAQILNWIKENKDVKIICYTQFLSMIRILARVCQEEGWQTEQYHGKLSFSARDKAITNFADNPKVTVLLASLRCGGLGLNLTMASRVIVLDPWWNSAAEQQAFCRVFRYGQKEKTFLTRFCVKDTIDDHIIDLQIKKQKNIDQVMEDNGQTVEKLSIRDLMRLFGNLQEDETGKPFIMVDNTDPRGGFRQHADDEGYADEL